MVVEMYQDGLSMDEIERQTPYSADRVVIQLRRQGVPIRPGSPVNLTDHNLRQAAALGRKASPARPSLNGPASPDKGSAKR
jgi:hypothetical protein